MAGPTYLNLRKGEKMAKDRKKEPDVWKCGNMLNIERVLRYDALPDCVIRILEYIEEKEKTEDDPIIVNTLGLFHNVLRGLCWEGYAIQAILYPAKDEGEEDDWRAQTMLTGGYKVIVAECVKNLVRFMGCDNVQDALQEAIGFTNAGVTLGNITEYAAW